MKKLFVILMLVMISAVMFSQQAIMVSSHSKVGVKGATFTNAQGFVLPKSVSDTTRVYQTPKGAQYYWRLSSKSGKIYKVYLPKK